MIFWTFDLFFRNSRQNCGVSGNNPFNTKHLGYVVIKTEPSLQVGIMVLTPRLPLKSLPRKPWSSDVQVAATEAPTGETLKGYITWPKSRSKPGWTRHKLFFKRLNNPNLTILTYLHMPALLQVWRSLDCPDPVTPTWTMELCVVPPPKGTKVIDGALTMAPSSSLTPLESRSLDYDVS